MDEASARLLVAVAVDSVRFCRDIPDGEMILLAEPTISLSSEGHLMVETTAARYIVEADSVYRTTPRGDGKVDVVVFRDGEIVRRAVAPDNPDAGPPRHPEVN